MINTKNTIVPSMVHAQTGHNSTKDDFRSNLNIYLFSIVVLIIQLQECSRTSWKCGNIRKIYFNIFEHGIGIHKYLNYSTQYTVYTRFVEEHEDVGGVN